MGNHVHDLDWAAMVSFAELEGEVLISFLEDTASLLAGLAEQNGPDVHRILDVGSGPGVGTCVLAQRFPAATVLAADGSPEMLGNVAARAGRLGLGDRVATRVVELPDGLSALGSFDLVWASLVLHHVGDEAAALRGLRERLDPGGLLALVEFGEPLRLLPEDADVGRAGLWERLDEARAAWLADMRAGLPGAVPSADYAAMLQVAGFDVVVDRLVGAHVDPPLDARARELAVGHLRRMREHVEPYAGAADLQALDVLIDEGNLAGILRRPDAVIQASRRLLVSRARA
jgi:SAM-dependent methyltransferase